MLRACYGTDLFPSSGTTLGCTTSGHGTVVGSVTFPGILGERSVWGNQVVGRGQTFRTVTSQGSWVSCEKSLLLGGQGLAALGLLLEENTCWQEIEC